MAKRLKVVVLPDEDQFHRFWEVYPRREAKRDARVAWAQLAPSEELVDAIVDALGWQRRQPQWLKQNGAFVPLPGTYLRGERWTDERQKALNPHVNERVVDRWICRHEPYCGNRIACGIVTAREERAKKADTHADR